MLCHSAHSVIRVHVSIAGPRTSLKTTLDTVEVDKPGSHILQANVDSLLRFDSVMAERLFSRSQVPSGTINRRIKVFMEVKRKKTFFFSESLINLVSGFNLHA